MEFIYKIAKIHSGISIFCGVGERMREGHELWREMQRQDIIENSILMFGQMHESPGIRFRAPLTAITLAEYFRDELGRDVLFLMDNIYRFFKLGMKFLSSPWQAFIKGWLPTNAFFRTCRGGRKTCVNKKGLYYLCAGCICPS